MSSEILEKIYIIETKIVNLSSVAGVVKKKRDKKMGLNFVKLLKTNIEKMSIYRLFAMLMKANELNSLSRDVGENKWERHWMERNRAIGSWRHRAIR